MRRPAVILTGLLAALALTASPARATITYTYMAALQDVNSNSTVGFNGDSSVSYGQGGGVAMALYLVENFTGLNKQGAQQASLINQQGGLFSSAVTVKRTGGSAADTGALISSQNIEYWTGATDTAHPGAGSTANPGPYGAPYGNTLNANPSGGYQGNNTSTNPFGGVNNVTGAVNGGDKTANVTVGLASGVAQGFATGVSVTGNGNATLYGQLANNAYAPGNGFPDTGGISPDDTDNYVGPNNVNNTTNGRNGSGSSTSGTGAAFIGHRVQFIGTVYFYGGSVGTTTFKVLAGGAADPLTFGGNANGTTGRYSLATDGVAGVTTGQGTGAPNLPTGFDYTGTNNFAGFDITVTVTPEPSSMLLGTFAVVGMGYGAYRRRMKKNAVA